MDVLHETFYYYNQNIETMPACNSAKLHLWFWKHLEDEKWVHQKGKEFVT